MAPVSLLGIALFPDQAEQAKPAAKADEALYKAKITNGNRVQPLPIFDRLSGKMLNKEKNS